jgi:hypothetical protein
MINKGTGLSRTYIEHRRTVTEYRREENKLNCHCRKLHERIDISEERALDNSVWEILRKICDMTESDGYQLLFLDNIQCI